MDLPLPTIYFSGSRRWFLFVSPCVVDSVGLGLISGVGFRFASLERMVKNDCHPFFDRVMLVVSQGNQNREMEFVMGIEPIVRRNISGVPVVNYRITFDGRKMTVHGPDGPRTRTRRNRLCSATTAMLREMGYNDFLTVSPDGTTEVFCYTTRRSL